MKKIFTTKYNRNLADIWLLISRMSVGALMITHGLPKLQLLFSGNEIMFLDPLGLGMTFSLILVVFAEFFASVLIIAGLGTRLATIPLIFTMFVAVFIFHSGHPFAQKELGMLYILIYFNLLVFGGGKYSADRLISGK